MSYLSPRGNREETYDFEFDEKELHNELTPNRKNKVASSLVPTVLSALNVLASNENLLVMNIAKTIITGAAGVLSGSVAAGLPGMAIGAAIAGGMIAAKALKKKSVNDVLKNMTPTQQKQLADRFQQGMKKHNIRNLAAEILQRKEVKDLAMAILSGFMNEKFGLKIVRGR